MPRFYILASITLILLTSCGPQATALPPQLPTATAQPTDAPAPTNSPTLTLEPWRVSLPESVASVEIEDDIIFGLDSQGEKIKQFDKVENKWVEVEKEVNSCVSPEAIAAQDAGFEDRTGIDLNNPDANSQSRKFLSAINETKHIGFSAEVQDVVNFSIIKTGFDIVSVNDSAGGLISQMVCIYGRNSVVSNKTQVFIPGWIDNNGNFVNLSFVADATNLNAPVGITPDKQLDFFKNLPDGAMLSIGVHTFSGVESIDGINSVSPSPSPNQDRVRELLRILDNGMVERFSQVGNISEYWDLQNPDLGDVGYVLAGDWKLFRLMDLSP